MQINFLGLKPPFTDLETARIVVLPVPFDLTSTYIHGADKGPTALIEASCNTELYEIETDSTVYKQGIHTAPALRYATSTEMLSGLYTTVSSYLAANKFVVTLGGEHGISTAPIKAHADYHGPISILHLDAHTDRMPSYEGDPHSHASVIARVQELQHITNIISVGIRSMGEEEKPFINPQHTFFAHTIHTSTTWMSDVSTLLAPKVYITLDLDVFDASLMPATGTPEPGGLFWQQVVPLLQRIATQHTIVGFDVVELCPIKGFVAPDFLAAKLVYKLLSFVFAKNK